MATLYKKTSVLPAGHVWVHLAVVERYKMAYTKGNMIPIVN